MNVYGDIYSSEKDITGRVKQSIRLSMDIVRTKYGRNQRQQRGKCLKK